MEVEMTGREDSAAAAEVVLGVDTHLGVHMAVALDQLGRLGALTVPTTATGYKSLISWVEGFELVRYVGVQGTGSYGGARLARHFKAAGIPVVEVERPKRWHPRHGGKSDPLDAEAAARAVLVGETTGEPKGGDGRETIRALKTARRSAVKGEARPSTSSNPL